MLKAYALRFHRWLALVFALPLAVLILTGLVLSFEPAVSTLAVKPGSLTAERFDALIAKADPEGKARMIALRPYDNALSVGGRGNAVTLDLTTGEPKAGGSMLSSLFSFVRPLHEHLVFDMDWLVTTSTIVMLVLVLLGILMGLPKMLRNNVSGWHKVTSWAMLPLVILSPLTGLALAFGITFAGSPPKADGAPVTMRQAAQIVGQSKDLSNLVWLRPRGQSMMVRLNEGGEYRIYGVSQAGLSEMQRNWPRLIHEGNWAGVWSALINVVTSIALVILMVTGLIIYLRRPKRKRKPQPA